MHAWCCQRLPFKSPLKASLMDWSAAWSCCLSRCRMPAMPTANTQRGRDGCKERCEQRCEQRGGGWRGREMGGFRVHSPLAYIGERWRQRERKRQKRKRRKHRPTRTHHTKTHALSSTNQHGGLAVAAGPAEMAAAVCAADAQGTEQLADAPLTAAGDRTAAGPAGLEARAMLWLAGCG